MNKANLYSSALLFSLLAASCTEGLDTGSESAAEVDALSSADIASAEFRSAASTLAAERHPRGGRALRRWERPQR